MLFAFKEKIGSLDGESRLRFYENLAHELTICVRGIWSDDQLKDAEKVDRMKWINEIQHRVTSKFRVLRLNTHEWSEEDFEGQIDHWVAQNSNLAPLLESAVRFSYDHVTNSI